MEGFGWGLVRVEWDFDFAVFLGSDGSDCKGIDFLAAAGPFPGVEMGAVL